MPDSPSSLVSVIVPCRNELRWIDAFLESILAQRLGELRMEVLIADGASDDGTRARLASWVLRDARLKMIDNPAGIVSTGLNEAIRRAGGDYVVRMDVHTTYADDYIAQCILALQSTGATCVGGAWVPVGEGVVSEAIAAAFSSRFGSGGARSRSTTYSGPVDTVYLGAWRRADLVRLGGFDEALVRNQDDELNLRIVRGGGTVWQGSAIRSRYSPRGSLKALFRQFFQYGYWKVAVIRKHHLPASPRHLVPFIAMAAVVIMAMLGLAWPAAGVLAILAIAGYAALALAVAARMASPVRQLRKVVCMAGAFAAMHGGYGLGFGRGLWDFVVLRNDGRAFARRLTR